MNELKKAVELLRSPVLRVKVGLWLMPIEYLGQEEDEAVRLGVEAIDFRKHVLAVLPPTAESTGLTPVKLFEMVDNISQMDGIYDVVLLYNFDLLLARLTTEGRSQFWQDFFITLVHRKRGVLLVVPETAKQLLPPDDELDQLTHSEQVIIQQS
jgi:hypothetical protein